MQSDLEQIAGRIRRWREEADLTLQELGDRAGVSASTIHKIENLQTIPTLTVFLKIASGFGRTPSDLLTPEGEPEHVALTRATERRTIGDAEGTRAEKMVAAIHETALEMWRFVIQPGVDSGDAVRQKDGELIIVCESGALTLWLDDEEYRLGHGDAIHCKASVARRWANPGPSEASALMAITLPERLSYRSRERKRELIEDRLPSPD